MKYYALALLIVLNIALMVLLGELAGVVLGGRLGGGVRAMGMLFKWAAVVAIAGLDLLLVLLPSEIDVPNIPRAITQASSQALIVALMSADMAGVDVAKIVSVTDGKVLDGWGEGMRIELRSEPSGAVTLAVRSGGGDRRLGTADDLIAAETWASRR